MWIPPQGFRYAATLLLANRIRAIPIDASANAVQTALERLALELVALARDMRVREDVMGWLIAEFNTLVDGLPLSFDRTATKAAAAVSFARVADLEKDEHARDLFLIHVPEDRLPIAAPLAIELTKRRMSVAFADYEVATASGFTHAVERGLRLHRRGALLWTTAFDRRGWTLPAATDRLRILRDADLHAAVTSLAAWLKTPPSEM
jgi:hypothetical protein